MAFAHVRAGLRAIEISRVTWDAVLDADGQVGDVLALHDKVTKGAKGGREIVLHDDLKAALVVLRGESVPARDSRVATSERGEGLTSSGIQLFFARLYARLGLKGASSHSGRRTFVTDLAKRIVACGGSLKDVQEVAGHASLATTQRYIQGNSDAKAKAIKSQGKPVNWVC